MTGTLGTRETSNYLETFQHGHNSDTTAASVPQLLLMQVQTIARNWLCGARIIGLALTAISILFFAFGCNEYNPYLGATPTVSSSITSITPSGATVGHGDVFLTVTGSGFVAGSDVTWNSSNSTSINLVSNFVSASEMQANIPSTLLTNTGTFFVGVIAPGPTSGNNAGENISNFMPFIVCSSSGCPAAVSATNK